MTEYEIADLALSKTFEAVGLGELYQAQLDSILGLVQQFMSVLFGFLAAAYFIGASLNRKQVVIFTSLYTVWQVWTIIHHTIRHYSAQVTFEKLRELGVIENPHGMTDFLPQLSAFTQFLLLCAALLASLYFMWDTRRSKADMRQ